MRQWAVRCLQVLSCAFVLMAAGSGGPATAANWLQLNFWLEGPAYDGNLPECQAAAALSEISSRFAQKEREFWNSDLAIVSYTHVREDAYRPWDRELIPRRYCSARVILSNGSERPVYYLIGEGYGMIGAGWGVQWCVVGYDRNWAYNPACKMARP